MRRNTEEKLGWMFSWVSRNSLVQGVWMGSLSLLHSKEQNIIEYFSWNAPTTIIWSICLTNPGQWPILSQRSSQSNPRGHCKAKVCPVMNFLPPLDWTFCVSISGLLWATLVYFTAIGSLSVGVKMKHCWTLHWGFFYSMVNWFFVPKLLL